ncbi:MAG: hypothetical protein RL521_1523 [Bacteroidota bacterium]|jgi:hypothetical protein
MYRISILLILGLFSLFRGFAQDIGTWNILNLKKNISPAWSVFAEGQIRSLSFYDQFHYWECKAGLNRTFHNGIVFTLAGGKYNTYSADGNFELPQKSEEWRIWPQIAMTQTFGKVKVEHRYRLEERFFTNGNFKHRFRFRVNWARPILKDSRLGIQNSFEIFFSPYEPYYERLRAMLGLTYRINEKSQIQMNYLRQFDYKIYDEIGKTFFQVGYSLNLN